MPQCANNIDMLWYGESDPFAAVINFLVASPCFFFFFFCNNVNHKLERNVCACLKYQIKCFRYVICGEWFVKVANSNFCFKKFFFFITNGITYNISL